VASAAEFKGKAALITGSSGGIGLRVAEQLAEAGAQVFINGRSGDCASYQDVATVVDTVRSAAGRLDILVSAGAEGEIGPTPFAKLTPEQIESACSLSTGSGRACRASSAISGNPALRRTSITCCLVSCITTTELRPVCEIALPCYIALWSRPRVDPTAGI
jgi:hypothetical protein